MQGAGNREEGGLEFPPTAHGSGVNSLRSLAEGAGWHLPPVWHSQLPPPHLPGTTLNAVAVPASRRSPIGYLHCTCPRP